ncbi:hypothetical protein F5X68DRAFT_226517 [Plectosphaerella plurivora]|uniref:Uncharacterized protein n=1 Tax=Plectosphaerella plurivora TaxID=936078 RepID=A0A9P8VME3_9PEZI|nr:hypothetical protein F5X68DRAFT_226517 [Plectosphaerella plurivora]
MTADEYLGSNFIGYEKQLAEAFADDKDNVPLYRHSSNPNGLHSTNELAEQRKQILQELDELSLDELLEASKQIWTAGDKLKEERVGPMGARASTIRLLRGLKNIDVKPTDVPSVMDDDDLNTDDESDGSDEIKAVHEDDDYLDSDGDVDDAGDDADGGYKPKGVRREHFTENGGSFDTPIQPEEVDAISADVGSAFVEKGFQIYDLVISKKQVGLGGYLHVYGSVTVCNSVMIGIRKAIY